MLGAGHGAGTQAPDAGLASLAGRVHPDGHTLSPQTQSPVGTAPPERWKEGQTAPLSPLGGKAPRRRRAPVLPQGGSTPSTLRASFPATDTQAPCSSGASPPGLTPTHWGDRQLPRSPARGGGVLLHPPAPARAPGGTWGPSSRLRFAHSHPGAPPSQTAWVPELLGLLWPRTGGVPRNSRHLCSRALQAPGEDPSLLLQLWWLLAASVSLGGGTPHPVSASSSPGPFRVSLCPSSSAGTPTPGCKAHPTPA